MAARYKDRAEAGAALAARLVHLANADDVVVLALPRGGVPVGAEVARALGAPLDVFLVRKLGAPGHAELAMGAVASGGVRVKNEEVLDALGIPDKVLDAVTKLEEERLVEQEILFRGDRHTRQAVRGKRVVVVDDGLATGASMIAAVRALRQRSPKAIIVAVPIGSAQAAAMVEQEADSMICTVPDGPFEAVGAWYEVFSQVSDEDVQRLLRGDAESRPPDTHYPTLPM